MYVIVDDCIWNEVNSYRWEDHKKTTNDRDYITSGEQLTSHF